jgi:Family of unknown function (DUF6210)
MPNLLGNLISSGNGRIVISLYQINSVGVIIFCPSGAVYSNQTGGYACNQPGAEGVFVPLLSEENGLGQVAQNMIDKHFWDKYGGWTNGGIDEETANFLDQDFFPHFHTTIGLKVDRQRLKESHEAWVYLEPSDFIGFDPKMSGAVLTWINSD